MNVKNRKCIRRLSLGSMKASRTRNLIAVLAIALTAMLFTSLFTIALSINQGFQESNFRQVGGISHGGFKYLSKEQFEELREDPLIKEWGVRRFLGMPEKAPFEKNHVELSWADENCARWMFLEPMEGRFPREGTNEAATDLEVLALLGIEPELGAEVPLTFQVNGTEVTRTFTLCGWWEYDSVVVANHVLVAESMVDEILAETGNTWPASDGMTGSWNLDVMLGSSLHIAGDLETILARHGYQGEDSAGEHYISTGVNWGYSGAQLADSMDMGTLAGIVGVLLLIIFTGYLIIYNVFQISVANDIRFYGLLKTIGVTGRQIRRMIRQQALLLSIAGIPLGLLLGWFTGAALTPVVAARLSGIRQTVSVSPVIFAASALFALVTVLLSCRRPGRMAARVSPVEAVRYTEASLRGKKTRRGGGHFSVFSMAWANLGRNKGKTVITITSLSLAVVLLNLTVTFTDGFDMDKYLRDMVADFIVGDAGYFQVAGEVWNKDMAVTEDVIEEISARSGVAEGGRVYGRTSPVEEFITEEYYRQIMKYFYTPEELDMLIDAREHIAEGVFSVDVQIYGMESFALGKLGVVEGDLSKLDEPGGRYVAAVYATDDYGQVREDSHWAKVGDTVTLRYVEEYEYYDAETGEIYGDEESIPETASYRWRAKEYEDVEYEVAALVTVPSAISYRYYGADEFVMNDETFLRDTGTDSVMLYAFDMEEPEGQEDNLTEQMEAFLSDYTENRNSQYDYESKESYAEEFESFRGMFLIMGGALSFIVGLVGVLNFFNAVLTGILARKREFAVLQSIGMTGRQLKTMLVWEGLLYALTAVLSALLLNLVLGPLSASVLEGMFWFFTYKLTLLPVLLALPVFALLGVLIPLAAYKNAARRTIVERLRESE
ncbi:MAG: ABC transporter permease [Eubacteriales bacterium]|nr:ABC transporter permease [Eubacteriales bacterium]